MNLRSAGNFKKLKICSDEGTGDGHIWGDHA